MLADDLNAALHEAGAVVQGSVPGGGAFLWGVAPTGAPHVGYAAHLLVSRCVAAVGGATTLLVADFHAFLDDAKASWESLPERSLLYEAQLGPSFSSVRRSAQDYLQPNYFRGLMRFSAELPVVAALKSGDGTLRADVGERRLADLLYTSMQMYDLAHFGVTFALCGRDEAPIYEAASSLDLVPADCSFAYLPVFPGVIAPEMHASDSPSNKILLDADASAIEAALASHIELHSVALFDSPIGEYCFSTWLPLLSKLRPDLVASGAEVLRLGDTHACAAWIREVLQLLSEPLQ